MRVGGAGRGDNFFACCAGFAVGDVFGDGAEKQERLLQHQTDVLTVLGHRHRADIDTVDQDGAFAHIVKAADQVDHRTLARSAVPHQADHLARLDRHADVACDAARAVTKADVAQLDAAGDVR